MMFKKTRSFLNYKNSIALRFIVPVCFIAIGAIGMGKLYLDFQVNFAQTGPKNVTGFYFFVVFIVFGVQELMVAVLKPEKNRKQNIRLLVGAIMGTLLLSELALRCLGINKTIGEQNYGAYVSLYERNDKDSLHLIPAKGSNYLQCSEYKYLRHRNNLGFRDIDFYPNIDSNRILIQTYGDSFTEGDGAPIDSSYPSILRNILQANGDTSALIQNFGSCGSDPAFFYKQLQRIGLLLKPDILVIVYGTNDMATDFFIRGGLERFNGGYMQYMTPPKWEILYAYSYIFRTFLYPVTGLEYNKCFVSERQRQERFKSLQIKWNETFLGIAQIAEKNRLKILLVKKPEHNEILEKRYSYDFSFFDQMLDTTPVFKRFDLLSYYQDSIHLKNADKYYWKINAHHNAEGYALMANGIYHGLKTAYTNLIH